MTGYLNDEQVAQLLRPINPRRVGKDARGFSHLQAYDVRAHLCRVFGFARWSQTVDRMELLYETLTEDKKVSVGYRALVTLTVAAPDGTQLAVYSEWAMGDAKNFPVGQRGDAHDFAMKTAESQGLKRAAANLGSNFGLSLYAQGSLNEIVGRTLVSAVERDDEAAVDDHVEATPPEDEPAPEPPETRERNGHAEPETGPDERMAAAEAIRDEALSAPPPGVVFGKHIGSLMARASRERVAKVQVVDLAGGVLTLETLLQGLLKTTAKK